MPDPSPPPDLDLPRFTRWARRVRFVGRFLCNTSHTPELVPESYGRPIVMVANHRSLADVFVAVEALDHFAIPTRCLVRAKYFDIPLAGRWLTAIGCIPAGDGSGESVDTASATLRAGRNVAIMIEGKIIPPDRRDADGIGDFRPGFIDIAREADAVIMPITLIGTDEVWGSRSRLPRIPWRGRPDVHVRISEAIVIDDLTDDEVMARTRTAIAQSISALT